MAYVITSSNFKGGVGKTTVNVLFAYLLSVRKHKKTLLIDLDPQGNASEILRKTYPEPISEPQFTFFEGLKQADITNSVTKFTDTLSALESDWKLVGLPEMLEDYKKDERKYLLRELLKPIKNDYDFILIDTPPTLSEYTNNAVFASDFVLAVLQTQEQAYSSTLKFISYLQDLNSGYDANFDLLGVIQYLIKKSGTVDSEIQKDAKDTFGAALFHENIYQRERVKGFGRNGIPAEKDFDIWDKKALYMYETLLNEVLVRLEDSVND